jgi:tRNA nucleotidyltransferase (CCA-adding enzyme)
MFHLLRIGPASYLDCSTRSPVVQEYQPGRPGQLCYNSCAGGPATPEPQNIHAPLDAIESSIGGNNLVLWRAVRRLALDKAFPVYLVGGPVRDVLLNVPVKDLDFVVEGDASLLACQLAHDLGGEAVLHARFGTASVTLEGYRADIVTARKEVYIHPGALPQVSPGSIYDDLARRDFSINSLALPLADSQPKILDPQGGIEDIEKEFIRTLHRRSFVDDPTRILRAVRYEQRCSFAIEQETLSQLQQAIQQGYITAVSGDRLRHELERTLEEKEPVLPLKRSFDLGALAAIHTALRDRSGLMRLAASRFSDENRGKPIGPLVYLAALVYPLSPIDAEGVINRLNMPGSWARVVRDTIELRRREPELAAPSLSASQIYRLVEGLTEAAVMAVSRVTESPVAARCLTQYLNELRSVSPQLNGRDLIAMGVPPGPLLGQLLRRLLEARLDRQVSTEAEERQLVRKILADQGV